MKKPKSYTISGIIFNDNGGISAPGKDDVTSKYLDNQQYFNGQFDTAVEAGISYTVGHSVTIGKCVGDSTGTPFGAKTININTDGTYKFDLTTAQVGDNTQLCVTQNEPSAYNFPVDTTNKVEKVSLTANQSEYPNNNFGDVSPDNAALVLTKR